MEQKAPTAKTSSERLILYSSLPVERVAPLADAYLAATGVGIDFLLDVDDVLIDKLRRKEHIPSADLLLISGGGHLANAVESDVLRPALTQIDGGTLGRQVADPDGYWIALGIRAELIAYNSDSVSADELAGYAGLGEPRWGGKLCLQRSIHDRSRALIAALIAASGEREAERIVRGWRANLATSVFDEQQAMLAAVDAGTCAVTIASSEHLTRYLRAEPDAALVASSPTAEHGGTFENVTGVGVSRHAREPEKAAEFIAWLLTAEGQRVLHADSDEFPVGVGLETAAVQTDWVGYDRSPIDVVRAGFHVSDAVLLAERARYR